MIRYTLPLLILRQILGLFSLFKSHEGPWGPQTNFFYFVRVVPVVIYLFHASWGLKHFAHGVEISKSSISSQIMLILGPLGPRGLAVAGEHHKIFLWAQLDCPWPEPYKSWCPCHLENFYWFWNTDLFLEHWLGFILNIAIL
jgi:hypothetical protein